MDLHKIAESLINAPLEESRVSSRELRQLTGQLEMLIKKVEGMRNPDVGIAWSQEQQRVLQQLNQAVKNLDRASASPLFR